MRTCHLTGLQTREAFITVTSIQNQQTSIGICPRSSLETQQHSPIRKNLALCYRNPQPSALSIAVSRRCISVALSCMHATSNRSPPAYVPVITWMMPALQFPEPSILQFIQQTSMCPPSNMLFTDPLVALGEKHPTLSLEDWQKSCASIAPAAYCPW